jgi:aminoglycoside 6'-N-acetyltransferase
VVPETRYATTGDIHTDYRHANLDIFLATEWQGQGLGSEALRLLAGHLFDERGHHRLTIDPAAANGRAIRAYERVGFRPVGVMREYERGPDRTWHDGLLMDLLATEFRPTPTRPSSGGDRSSRTSG